MSIQEAAGGESSSPCPLCGDTRTGIHHVDRARAWLRCPSCALVFVPQQYHLTRDAEKRRYDQHRNDPGDPAYRGFLSALYLPLRARLPSGAAGLDFGSGPGPTLSLMFAEAGHPMRIYDPFYAPDRSVLQQTYDFVTCSETAEHFCAPASAWESLVGLVKPGGWLGVMTAMLDGVSDFSRWYYKDDPTHVSFYSRASIDWLARRHRLRVEYPSPSVILLQRC